MSIVSITFFFQFYYGNDHSLVWEVQPIMDHVHKGGTTLMLLLTHLRHFLLLISYQLLLAPIHSRSMWHVKKVPNPFPLHPFTLVILIHQQLMNIIYSRRKIFFLFLVYPNQWHRAEQLVRHLLSPKWSFGYLKVGQKWQVLADFTSKKKLYY